MKILDQSIEEMVETYLNGNISDFKKWLKHIDTLEMLYLVQYVQDTKTDISIYKLIQYMEG
jgi:hypothetical protein